MFARYTLYLMMSVFPLLSAHQEIEDGNTLGVGKIGTFPSYHFLLLDIAQDYRVLNIALSCPSWHPIKDLR